MTTHGLFSFRFHHAPINCLRTLFDLLPTVLVFAVVLWCQIQAGLAAETLGPFESHADIGKPGKGGAVDFDVPNRAFVLTGGGENMWFTNDAFHFVWKKMSGDLALRSAIEWVDA